MNKTVTAILLCAGLLIGCSSEQDDAQDVVSAPPSAQSEANTTNMVLITIDTIRHDTFHQNAEAGLNDALSPWLERATQFDAAQATAPWTIPSIATTLTGLYPPQHTAGSFPNKLANLSKEIPSPLPEDIPTVTELLTQDGIRAGGYSAHPWFTSGYGLERGFEELGARKGAVTIIKKTLDWIDGKRFPRKPAPKASRFFAYMHFMEAHDWHLKNGQELKNMRAEMSEQALEIAMQNAPANICDDPDYVMCQKYITYSHAVTFLREQIAYFLQELDDRGLLQDTAVLIYSDHGEEFHDHLAAQRKQGRYDPRGILGFGHGQSLYQELIHVPLVVWHPNMQAERVQNPVSLVDIKPSILNWMNVENNYQQWPGMLLQDAQAGLKYSANTAEKFHPDWTGERHIFSSGISYGYQQTAVRSKSQKTIWHEHKQWSEFFDLQEDPNEKQPLDVDDDMILRFDPLLADYVELKSARVAESPELNKEQLERLKSIGYLQGVEEETD